MIQIIKEVYSKNGNKIQLFKVGSCYSSDSKIILFIGVFHGDEPEGKELIENLIDAIEKNPEITNNTVLFIPSLNPDGKILNIRGNSNGVDLNRNFPTKNWELSAEKDIYYSGKSPASEIETRFLTDIIEEYKPNLIITIHKPYKVVNYDGPAKEIAEKISQLNGYPVQQDIGYPTPGSFGTYAGVEKNIPVITLELPDNTDINTLWQENKKAFLYLANLKY